MSKKALRGLIALILVVILAVGATIAWGIGSHWGEIKNVKDYFNGWGISKPDNSGENNGDQNVGDITEPKEQVKSLVITPDELTFNLMSLVAEPMALSETENESYTLTATLYPNVGSVEWSVGYVDSAVTGNASEYISVTSTSATTCRVECLGAFSHQIMVTASVVANPSITASCRVDYKQKITGIVPIIKTTVNGTEYDLLKRQAFFNQGAMPDFETSVKFTKSAGTIPINAEEANLKLYVKIDDSLATYFNTQLTAPPEAYRKPGEVGAREWTLVNETTVSDLLNSGTDYYVDYKADNKLSYDTINSAYLYSRLYEAMYDGNGGLNDLVSFFVGNVLSGWAYNYGQNQVAQLMYLRFELTLDGQTVEYETLTYVRSEYMIANTVTLDTDSIVF